MWNPDLPVTVSSQVPYSPYSNNGGSVVAIAGKDYVLIASDTRLSVGNAILTRDQVKVFDLGNRCMVGSSGSWNDVLTFKKTLEVHVISYKLDHRKEISTDATAHLMAVLLYSKRFFPFYETNILAGLDREGKGCVYSFDPYGSMSKGHYYQAIGSGQLLMMPFLDSALKGKDYPSQNEAVKMVRDAFQSTAERDTQTGDCIVIKIITQDEISEMRYDLRKD